MAEAMKKAANELIAAYGRALIFFTDLNIGKFLVSAYSTASQHYDGSIDRGTYVHRQREASQRTLGYIGDLFGKLNDLKVLADMRDPEELIARAKKLDALVNQERQKLIRGKEPEFPTV